MFLYSFKASQYSGVSVLYATTYLGTLISYTQTF